MQNYLGSNNGSGVYQRIVQLIPPHDTFIEPFLIVESEVEVEEQPTNATRDIMRTVFFGNIK